jgi:hypothetical protein
MHPSQQHQFANMDPHQNGNIYRQQMNAAQHAYMLQQQGGMAAGQGVIIPPQSNGNGNGHGDMNVNQQMLVVQRMKLEQEGMRRRYLTQMRMRGIPMPMSGQQMPMEFRSGVDMSMDMNMNMDMNANMQGQICSQMPMQQMRPQAQMLPQQGPAIMSIGMPRQQDNARWQQAQQQPQQMPPPQQQISEWGPTGLSPVQTIVQPVQQTGWNNLEQSTPW